jgi:hypothetical protein
MFIQASTAFMSRMLEKIICIGIKPGDGSRSLVYIFCHDWVIVSSNEYAKDSYSDSINITGFGFNLISDFPCNFFKG